jgi:eukaryotic-like serine/threonine-protein kinase
MFCPRCGEQVDTSNRYCPRCGQDLTQLTGAGRAGATVPITATAAPQPQQESEDAAVAEALKDEYELEKELGRGGMAVVYKMRDKQLEREVAVKVLPFSLSFDAEFVERFQREARTAGKLEHPNIIPIYRVGKSGRVIYFVMKYIRGKSLSAVIESRGALPVPEIKRLLIECTRALGYAHKHGIVHRDIKPDNIMFDELGQAIVTDFGIAKAQSGARLTGTGMSIGTPHYMSPEQARAQNLDGRSDIYSLGVVAYQALTGHVPFDGEDSFSIGYKHIMEELPVPSLETADQRDLFGVIQKMMAKKPDDRFQSADELVAALESGAGPSPMDLATMPTRAIEPFKPPTAAPTPKSRATPMTPMAAQPTTPLPRASASMSKPNVVEPEETGAPAPPPPPAVKRRPFKAKEAEKRGGGGGLIAAVLGLLVVGGGGAGYYFAKYKPDQVRAQAQRDSLARVESLATARTDSLRRDSVRADSIAQLAAHARPAAPPPATTPPPATASRPAPSTATAAAARPGMLRLGGQIPSGARVTINGEQRTGTTFQLPAGRYQIAIEAQGYRPYSNTTTIQAGRTASIKVMLTPATGAPTTTTTTPPPSTATAAAAVNCAAPTVYQQNPQRACWDTRPIPNTRPQLQAPGSCTGRVTPANILVNVSVAGEAISANISRASSCQEFTQRALAYVQDMTFRPSTKNGAAVAGWVIVPVTPSP